MTLETHQPDCDTISMESMAMVAVARAWPRQTGRAMGRKAASVGELHLASEMWDLG